MKLATPLRTGADTVDCAMVYDARNNGVANCFRADHAATIVAAVNDHARLTADLATAQETAERRQQNALNLVDRLKDMENERDTARADLADAVAALKDVLDAPECAYPESDCYGLCEDADAPLWTEAGLYGRVGKDAARTLLRKLAVARALVARVEART